MIYSFMLKFYQFFEAMNNQQGEWDTTGPMKSMINALNTEFRFLHPEPSGAKYDLGNGVTMSFAVDEQHPDILQITGMDSVNQQKGFGGAALTKITWLADMFKVKLSLVPEANGIPQEKLEEFYRRYGFVDHGGLMIRMPK